MLQQRWCSLAWLAVWSLMCKTAVGQYSDEFLPGPADPAQWQAWLTNITIFKQQILAAINFTGGVYGVPALLWTQSTYIQPQVMAHDTFLYDRWTGQYTADKYLDDLLARYGGIDSVLLWPTYPNLGIDNRNQFDLVRAMPGSLAGLQQFSNDLLARGVRLMLPYNPWDTGTRYEGQSDDVVLTQLLQDVQAYGFNGDTMYGIPQIFYQDSVNNGWPVALEPEVGQPYENINWSAKSGMGWGYWGPPYPFIPLVDVYKWLDARRMTHICDRWQTNHTDDIQHAFFNGIGFESWENVWGIWNQMSARDSEATRRAASILRFFAPNLVSQAWLPHVPVVQSWTVFASLFPLVAESQLSTHAAAHAAAVLHRHRIPAAAASSADSADLDWLWRGLLDDHDSANQSQSQSQNQSVLWLFVNRGDVDSSGPQLVLPSVLPPEVRFFDAYHGVPLKPQLYDNDTYALEFDIEGLGFGAVYATTNPSQQLYEFLDKMAAMTAAPLADFSMGWQPLLQTMLVYEAVDPVASAPPNMQFIPGIANYQFIVSGVEIEGWPLQSGMDFQYPWESHPDAVHNQTLEITPFYMDTYPVTNADFFAYLQNSSYAPVDPYNYLADWVNGQYPQGWDNKPVTWLSLTDVSAYCKFYGKRLPNEWEWQYAAQGADLNLYPWGNEWDATRVPTPDTSRTIRPPDDVTAHAPQGNSVFGVSDLVGNVWQWCNEAEDTHTRAAALKGTSYYQPVAAPNENWYFPPTYELNTHGKYLLLSDSYDRSGTIGFRCVVDSLNS